MMFPWSTNKKLYFLISCDGNYICSSKVADSRGADSYPLFWEPSRIRNVLRKTGLLQEAQVEVIEMTEISNVPARIRIFSLYRRVQ